MKPTHSPTPASAPVRCPSCSSDFYPLSRVAEALTTCPRCARQAPISSFMELGVQRFEDLQHPVGVAEAEAEAVLATAKRFQFRFMSIAGVVVLAAVGIAGYMLLKKKRRAVQVELSTPSSQTDAAAAFDVVQQLIGKSQEKLPAELVRDADRIRPLWEWYYQQPEAITATWQAQSYVQPRTYETQGKRAMALRVMATTRYLDVLLEGGSSGWKVDWEAFSGVHGGRWQVFLKQDRDLGTEGDYCVHVEIMPAALIMPSFHLEHGSTGKGVKVLKLFAAERERFFATAVIQPESPVAGIFANVTEDAEPLRMVLKLKMLQPLAYPPVVEPLALVRKGWDQLDPPGQATE